MPISTVTRAALARIWDHPQDSIGTMLAPVGWWTGDLDEVEFLDRIYPLDEMPSTDDRVPNASEDIRQHCLNNDDWSGFWVIRDSRFRLDDDATLLTLLAETIHPAVRTDAEACGRLAQRYNELLRRDGVELYVASRMSGRAVYGGRPYVPSAAEIREALATAIGAEVKAYDVAAFCEKIGLGPTSDEYGQPMNSKAMYVRRHALHADRPQLLRAARATLAEFHDVDLHSIVAVADGSSDAGVVSPPKNLIFAASGPKPELVLKDAISNDIQITKNAEYCLVYDRPLSDEGLSWQDLVDWWRESRSESAEPDVERDLYFRLQASLSEDSPGELLILRTYGHLIAEIGGSAPSGGGV